MKQTKRPQAKSSKIWIPILVILVIAAGGVGYYYWTTRTAQPAQTAAPVNNTTTVRQGNIELSASGSGTLVAAAQTALSFSTSGTVAKVNVQAGDAVKKDQELATLADQLPLQAALASAQQDLISAQQALDTLKQNAPANLANAQLALINAQKSVTTAQSGLIKPGMTRCDQTTTDAYYNTYLLQKQKLTALGDGGGNNDYYLTTIVPQKNIVAEALAAYQNCAGFTTYEIQSSQANLDLSNAQVVQAQANLDLLKKNNGINPIDLATAQNKVTAAQIAVDQAQTNLDGATIKAPYDGVILTIAGQAGDSVGTTSFITMADMTHPLVQFSVDETDLDKVALQEPAEVVFDALPNQTFKGVVTQISPALVTQSGSTVVQGLIQLDLSKETTLPVLPQGLTATVTLTKASANNVLLVPLQALRDLGDGSFAVFVAGADGQLKLQVVQVGLEDSTNAEIKSGLKAGDVISTGLSQTK